MKSVVTQRVLEGVAGVKWDKVHLFCERGDGFLCSAMVRTPWYCPPIIEFYLNDLHYTLVLRTAKEAYSLAHHIVRQGAREFNQNHRTAWEGHLYVMRWLRGAVEAGIVLTMQVDYPEDTSDEY